ncbi:MAG: hypothetical protein ACD_26C00073G0004 [uncultured bacterium]|nr:MAG: hypothetical protein ACD_26C00073G0004 [uncultured bacterium]
MTYLLYQELSQIGVNTKFSLVDAGYYNEENIKNLYSNTISFLTRLPSNRNLYKMLIEEHSESLEDAQNIITYGKQVLFVKRVPVDLFGNKGFAYIILDGNWNISKAPSTTL